MAAHHRTIVASLKASLACDLGLSPGCQVCQACQDLLGSCQVAVRRCQVSPCQVVVWSARLRPLSGLSGAVRPVRSVRSVSCQALSGVRYCQVLSGLPGAARPIRPVRTRLGHNHLTTSTQIIITTPLMDTCTLHPHEFFVHHLFLYITSSWRFRNAIATPPAACDVTLLRHLGNTP